MISILFSLYIFMGSYYHVHAFIANVKNIGSYRRNHPIMLDATPSSKYSALRAIMNKVKINRLNNPLVGISSSSSSPTTSSIVSTPQPKQVITSETTTRSQNQNQNQATTQKAISKPKKILFESRDAEKAREREVAASSTSKSSSKSRSSSSSSSHNNNKSKDNIDRRKNSNGSNKNGKRSSSSSKSKRTERDTFEDLSFSNTIEINNTCRLPIHELNNCSLLTKQILTNALGFTSLTPVQTESYPYIYSGVDVVVRSKTGTGKTLAFGTPLIEKILPLITTSHTTTKNNLNKNDSNNKNKLKCPIILILEPTRELVLQITQSLYQLTKPHNIQITAIYGGVPYEAQTNALKTGNIHILVSTPGRLIDHITKGNVDLSSIQHVVLDEGDMMLEFGFQKHVETILATIRLPGKSSMELIKTAFDDDDDDDNYMKSFEAKSTSQSQLLLQQQQMNKRAVQVLLFSATMAGWICELTAKHMVNPVFLDDRSNTNLSNNNNNNNDDDDEGNDKGVNSSQLAADQLLLPSTITHKCMGYPRSPTLNSKDKYSRLRSLSVALYDILLTHGATPTNANDDNDDDENNNNKSNSNGNDTIQKYNNQVIIFTNTKAEADSLVSHEKLADLFQPRALHGDMTQGARQTIIRQFKENKFRVLIATDVASRGLDIENVNLIIQTQFPNDIDTFIHRSGRTGRAGKKGNSILLFSDMHQKEIDKLKYYENSLHISFQKLELTESNVLNKLAQKYPNNIDRWNGVEAENKKIKESLIAKNKLNKINNKLMNNTNKDTDASSSNSSNSNKIKLDNDSNSIIISSTASTQPLNSDDNKNSTANHDNDDDNDDDDDDDDISSASASTLSSLTPTYFDLTGAGAWEGTEERNEEVILENARLRDLLLAEINTGVISTILTPAERDRAQLLIDRSARKKDKRAQYYQMKRDAKVLLEQEERKKSMKQ